LTILTRIKQAMNAVSKIDMATALRLTRAGKLKEAVLVLRGGAGAPAVAPAAEPVRGLKDFLPKFRVPGRPAAPVDEKFVEHSFTNEAGTRAYKLYTPSAYRGQALPLVVMLHGCTQSPDDFAAGTRMNELAEAQKFFVAYPAQAKAANMQRCWNWFNAQDQQRDAGEPSIVAGITRQIMRDHAVKPGEVFVAGLSAGGALAAIMGERYPDLYAAIGVHSGLACGAASNMVGAFKAMQGGGTPAVAAGGAVIIPTIVFHGDNDKTVNVVNGGQVIAQVKAGAALAAAATEGVSAGGVSYTKTVETDGRGRPLLEQWILHGAGHAWAGGSEKGSFTDPAGPDASGEMWRFFMETSKR
jgi:poly(hydroxyalkanoate) depolymerase family esterase